MADTKEWLKNSKALPIAVLGGIITAVGVASIGLLAAGQVVGDALSLLALGGGFASIAFGGNTLFTAYEIWQEEEKVMFQNSRENRAQSRARSNSLGRGISKALSRTTGQRSSESRPEGEVQMYAHNGRAQRTSTYVNGRRVPESGKQGESRIEYTAQHVGDQKASDLRTNTSSKSKKTNISKRPSGNDDR